MLTCNNLTCMRGDRRIFDSLGFTIGTGTVLVLRGSNGSGKTTLMKMLAGLIKPTAGDISWYKLDIHSDLTAYHRDILMIGHKNAIKPELTVADNIRLWSKLRHTEEIFDAALHYFQLTDKRDIPCYMLSEGWQRRVALARTIACHAELWLLDEPMANLDGEGKRLMVNIINTRTQQGGIVVLSSHEPLPLTNACELYLEDFKSSNILEESDA